MYLINKINGTYVLSKDGEFVAHSDSRDEMLKLRATLESERQ